MIIGKIVDGFRGIANGFANWFGRERNPTQMYQLKIDEAVEKEKRAEEAQRKLAGHIAGITRERSVAATEVKRLTANIDFALKKGMESAAIKNTTDLTAAKTKLAMLETNLAKQQQMYEVQKETILQAREEIAKVRQKAQELKLELDLSKANKEMAEAQAEISENLSNPLGELSTLESEIRSQIDNNNAAATVNADLGIGGKSEQKKLEEEMAKAEAEDYLAKRRAELGLTKPEEPAK